MATFWVDPLRPDNLGDGLTPATAKRDIDAGLQAMQDDGTKGNICNLMNTATHAWPITPDETNFTSGIGTNFTTDPGFTIRGRTALDAPAMVTIKPLDGDGDVARRIMRFSSGSGYCIVENLIFDATNRTDASTYNVVRVQPAANDVMPTMIRNCGIKGHTADGDRTLLTCPGTQPNDTFRIEHCYFENCKNPMGLGYGGSILVTHMHHCVGIWTSTGRTNSWYRQGGFSGADVSGNDVQFYNNTFYEDSGVANTLPIWQYLPSNGASIGNADLYNNLVWIETTGTVEPLASGSLGVTGLTKSGIINNNVLLGGPNVTAGSLDATKGWYENPWDANDDDLTEPDTQPNDVVSYGEADTGVFQDPASTFAWVLPNGLTITILKDLRPIKFTEAGRFNTVPGALPTLVVIPVVEDPIEFIDVLPVFAPVLRMEYNARLSTSSNRIREYYVRSDVENRKWREYAARRIILGPGEQVDIITGLQTGRFYIMESDNPVEVSIGDTIDAFLPPTKVMGLLGGSFTVLQLRNPSLTVNAEPLISVVD